MLKHLYENEWHTQIQKYVHVLSTHSYVCIVHENALIWFVGYFFLCSRWYFSNEITLRFPKSMAGNYNQKYFTAVPLPSLHTHRNPGSHTVQIPNEQSNHTIFVDLFGFVSSYFAIFFFAVSSPSVNSFRFALCFISFRISRNANLQMDFHKKLEINRYHSCPGTSWYG